jgi:Type II site-specific deoxyribonuclease
MSLFSKDLITAIRTLIYQHHTVYPRIPPQGIYFESLVERAFRITGKPFTPVEPSRPNMPAHDLIVEGQKISIKTETGSGTKKNRISITKVCTTEKDPWEAESLREHVLGHLSRYDHLLMLRAVWSTRVIHYQTVDIPISLLRKIKHVELNPVGRRKGRKSIGGDALVGGDVAFHVHFDGSDGKCQIRNLRIELCTVLSEWDYQIPSNP